MKHIVTLSLVFFSLTHLAKAERMEGLRIIGERYCSKQQVSTVSASEAAAQDQDKSPFFLSYQDLTTNGTIPAAQKSVYEEPNFIMGELTLRANAKNNSP